MFSLSFGTTVTSTTLEHAQSVMSAFVQCLYKRMKINKKARVLGLSTLKQIPKNVGSSHEENVK